MKFLNKYHKILAGTFLSLMLASLITLIISLLIIMLMIFVTKPAKAQDQAQDQAQSQDQTTCGLRATMVKRLAEKYFETQRSIGIASNNVVMEVFANTVSETSTGTWTIIVTTPQGLTCFVASGYGYEAVVEELPAKGDPV